MRILGVGGPWCLEGYFFRIYSDNYIIIIFFALDQERRVIQLAVVRNVLTLSVVIACTGIKFHMCTVLVKK